MDTIKELDPEMTNHMNACVKNLVREVNHLKEFLKDKNESYISSNPEEVAYALTSAGLSAEHIIGAYTTLKCIRETGMVPNIEFLDA